MDGGRPIGNWEVAKLTTTLTENPHTNEVGLRLPGGRGLDDYPRDPIASWVQTGKRMTGGEKNHLDTSTIDCAGRSVVAWGPDEEKTRCTHATKIGSKLPLEATLLDEPIFKELDICAKARLLHNVIELDPLLGAICITRSEEPVSGRG